MADRTDHDEADVRVGVAPRVRPVRGDPLVLLVLWVLVACGLVTVAAVQEHPGVVERTAVGFVLLAAAGISVALATRAQLVGAMRWLVPSVAVLVLVGVWNPWQLAVVTLLLDHPFVAATTLGLIGVVVLLGAPTWSERPGAHLGALLALLAVLGAVQVVAAFSALYLSAGTFTASGVRRGDGAVRVDLHDASDQGRCQVVVLRTGSGITMRERTIDVACYPAVSLGVTPEAIEVCVVADRSTATRGRFDPTTLAPLGATEAFEVADGRSCPAYGGAP